MWEIENANFKILNFHYLKSPNYNRRYISLTKRNNNMQTHHHTNRYIYHIQEERYNTHIRKGKQNKKIYIYIYIYIHIYNNIY